MVDYIVGKQPKEEGKEIAMQFSLPTNWQESILTEVVTLNKNREITEVYGKLAFDDVGGGRPASALAFVSRSQVESYINKLHQHGLKFNYLLNALCMDNIEFTLPGQRKMHRLIDWLQKAGVDSVTVANVYLSMWLKRNYPLLPLHVSVMANVDSLNKAKFWESLGVDKITFPGSVVNRNFNLIRLLRSNLKCKMQLIANNGCINNCPTHINHLLLDNHASQKWHVCKGYMFDYHLLMCRCARLKNPDAFIRADWIRPEDVGFYESLGVDSIKLVDRRYSADLIIEIVRAYINRSYEGNILKFLNSLQGKSYNKHKGWMRKLLFVGNIFSMNPFKILKLSQLLSMVEASIDNKKLDGFLANIPKTCDTLSCATCGYCAGVAARVVQIDQDYRNDMLKKYSEAMSSLYADGLSFSLSLK